VDNARGFQHPVELKGGPACLEAVEEALTRAGDHRVQLKVDLVDKARRAATMRAGNLREEEQRNSA
jgi:hypothetical protein